MILEMDQVAHDKFWGMKSKSWRIIITSLTPELLERVSSGVLQRDKKAKETKTMSVWKSVSHFALSKAAV